jgi:ubiquinone/menaquinone biosynthesis C-methylase UbiE
MELSHKEFQAMNNPLRALAQRRLEMPFFRRLGLVGTGRRILEVGCGSGYGAVLLAALKPAAYHGIDIMPAQIALARRRGLPGCTFAVGSAADLECDAPRGPWDTVVVFGVLHHMPEWRQALRAMGRVLAPGGELFIEEPDGAFIRRFDQVFHWGHPLPGGFRLTDLERAFAAEGFVIQKALRVGIFAAYGLKRRHRAGGALAAR